MEESQLSGAAEQAVMGWCVLYGRVYCMTEKLVSLCMSVARSERRYERPEGVVLLQCPETTVKHLASLAEHCSFCRSSGIIHFDFSFVFCAPAFALQVADRLKEDLNVNRR